MSLERKTQLTILSSVRTATLFPLGSVMPKTGMVLNLSHTSASVMGG
jgi:hypothetical protein